MKSSLPDDLIASDPPPAFPPWMVAADPRLAAQDTNRIYQAFRRRRVLHGRADTLAGGLRRSVSRGRGAFSFWLMSGGTASLAIALVILLGAVGCVVALALAAISALAYALRRRSTRLFDDSTKSGYLPLRLAEGFPVAGRDPATGALETCWTVGVTGREVAEAIYLELRERDVWQSRLVAALLATPAVVFFAVGIIARFSSFEYWAVALPAMLWLLGCLLLAWRGAIYQRPHGHLRKLVRGWQRSYPRYRGVGGPMGQFFDLELGYVLPQLVAGILIFVMVMMLSVIAIVAATSAAAELLGRENGAAGGILAAVAIAVPAVWAMLVWQRWEYARQIAILIDREADEAFAVMVGRFASGDDPDDLRGVCAKRRLLEIDDAWTPTPGMLELLGPLSLAPASIAASPPSAPSTTTPPPPPPPG